MDHLASFAVRAGLAACLRRPSSGQSTVPTRIEFDPVGLPIATVTLREQPRVVEQILDLFSDTSTEKGWEPGDQLTAYSRSSVYFALVEGGQVQGAVQLVRGGTEEGLPVLTVWPELAAPPADLKRRHDVADVALVALRPVWRGRRHLYWALYAAMWRFCVGQRITELWMEVPPNKLASYRRLGWPLSVEGPLRPHWDEPCFPCRVSVHGVGEAMIDRARLGGAYQKTIDEEYRELGAARQAG